jgi:general secretion pathway protein D
MLKQAQRAMHEGNFSLAESLINRADQMGAGRANLLAPNFAYTPDKARAELAKLQAERGGSQPPSASASPALLDRNSGPSRPRSLPMSGRNPIDRIGDSQKQAAQRYLEQGRAALQQGNHLAAHDYYRKAVSVGATFGSGEYSPRDLASDLKARGVDVGRLADSRGSAFDVSPPTAERGGVADRIPSYAPLRAPGGASDTSRTTEYTNTDRGIGGLNANKKEAEAKLLQARRELARGRAPEASKIAEEVRSMGVRFELRDDSPDRIDSLVRRFYQLAKTPETGRSDDRFRRQYSELLLEQAEWLLRYGDTEPAKHLAKRAESQGVRYAPQERTPSQLLAEINGASRPSGPATPGRESISPNKKKALALMAQAQAYFDRGDTYNARRLVEQVRALGVASSEFGPDEPNPDWLAMKIKRASSPAAGGVSHAVYDSAGDRTRTRMAQFTLPAEAANATAPELFEAGEKAYKDRDLAAAEGYYKAAWKRENELNPHLRQMLQERLQSIQIAIGGVGSAGGTVLEEVETEQQVYRRKIFAEVSRAKSMAQRLREDDPAEALRQLDELRNRVNQSQLSVADRQQLLSSIDFASESTQQYIEENRYRILAEQETADAKDRIERRHAMRAEINSKLNDIVDEFNELMDQQRWDEAEVLARQAKELDPDSELTTALNWKAKFVKRYQAQLAMRAQYDDGFWGAMQAVDESAIPFDDRDPYVHGDVREWSELSENRLRRLRDQSLRMSPGEAKIRAALSQLVDVRFEERPLVEVLQTLGTAVGINIYLDEQGLAAEGKTSDTPVTINLTQEPISLKSALNLILQQHRLSYVIRDEVLVVTSEQMKDTDVRTTVYDVADLVIPIPNFVPSYNIGLPGAIKAAHNALGYGALGTNMGNTAVPLVAQNGGSGGMPGGSVLSNLMANNGAGLGSLAGSRAPQPIGYGPGGLGGGAQADFDMLIDLITSTIAPTTWTVGGPGSVEVR